jgi:cell division protein FtsN
VAKIIKDHPEITKVEIQGHTDTEGPRQHNLLLSQRRADSVRKALIRRGVDFQRLDSKGYGPDQPIADNATPEGRAKNRRVQFKILQKKAGSEVKPADPKPTGANPAEKKPAGPVEAPKPAEKKPAGAAPVEAPKPAEKKP